MAADSFTGKVYVANMYSDDVTVITGPSSRWESMAAPLPSRRQALAGAAATLAAAPAARAQYAERRAPLSRPYSRRARQRRDLRALSTPARPISPRSRRRTTSHSTPSPAPPRSMTSSSRNTMSSSSSIIRPITGRPRPVSTQNVAIDRDQGGWVGFHHAALLGDFDGWPMSPWFSNFMGGIRFTHYILPNFARATVKSKIASTRLPRACGVLRHRQGRMVHLGPFAAPPMSMSSARSTRPVTSPAP